MVPTFPKNLQDMLIDYLKETQRKGMDMEMRMKEMKMKEMKMKEMKMKEMKKERRTRSQQLFLQELLHLIQSKQIPKQQNHLAMPYVN